MSIFFAKIVRMKLPKGDISSQALPEGTISQAEE
jgi:hypothetical protein